MIYQLAVLLTKHTDLNNGLLEGRILYRAKEELCHTLNAYHA